MTDILHTMVSALLQLLSLDHLVMLLIGVASGLVVGILPGLGGVAGLSLMVPFTFDMQPSMALAMMMGLLAPLHTCDSFPAILMGVPGTAAAQATVLDGFPLSRKGEAARALSAAFLSSAFGGLFGTMVLTIAVFGAESVILSMGFGELMMLTIFALSVVGMLTESSPLKGLAACGVGLLVGSIGGAPATGEFRLAFGSIYLGDGVPLIVVGLGLFAIPEIINLLRHHTTISETGKVGTGWLIGAKDVLRNWALVVRCAAIGAIVGIMPGIGAAVGDWIAYAHAMQTTKNRENFGKGEIRGVIAPESTNNAVTAGDLIPTLLFGIPGSGSMAVLLGGFVLIGIQPGPEMVTTHLDLTFTIIWSLALANLIGAVTCFALATPISKLTTIPYALIAPVMLVILFFGAFQATRGWGDFIALVCVGLVGIQMKRFSWPRPALLIGYVLSRNVEVSFYRVTQVYGWSFLERPLVLAIGALTLLSIFIAWRMRPAHARMQDSPPFKVRLPQAAFTLGLLVAVLYAIYDASQHTALAAAFPLIVGSLTLCLLVLVFYAQTFSPHPRVGMFADSDLEGRGNHSNLHYIAWILGMLVSFAILGFPIGAAVFVTVFTSFKAGGPFWRNLLMGICILALFHTLAYVLNLYYPTGLISTLLPRWTWLA